MASKRINKRSQRIIIREIETGGTLHSAAEKIGTTSGAIQRLKKADKVFADAYQRAWIAKGHWHLHQMAENDRKVREFKLDPKAAEASNKYHWGIAKSILPELQADKSHHLRGSGEHGELIVQFKLEKATDANNPENNETASQTDEVCDRS